MPLPTITVKDAAGVTQTINTTPSGGQALAAASLPVVLASDQTSVPVTISAEVEVKNDAGNPLAVAGPLTDEQMRATPVPVSIAELEIKNDTGNPLPVSAIGGATAANQAIEIAAIAAVGTRAYAPGIARLAYAAPSSASAAIVANEVMVHNCGAARCFVAAGAAPVATPNDIPIEAGEKFTLRITSGHKIAALQDTAAGNLNIVPVA